jgi:hypothetical protein
MPASSHEEAPLDPADRAEGGGISCPRERASIAAPDTDQLFYALDGRDLEMLGGLGHTEVYAVFDGGGNRWVQVLLAGRSCCMVTLKLALGDGVAEAVSALQSEALVSFAPFQATVAAHDVALR